MNIGGAFPPSEPRRATLSRVVRMAINKYISCAKCKGVGVVPIHPPEEWTPDMEKHFIVCPTCNGFGRVRENSSKKAEAAGN